MMPLIARYNTKVCIGLSGVFLLGAAANFGRVYLMRVAGKQIILPDFVSFGGFMAILACIFAGFKHKSEKPDRLNFKYRHF